MRFHETALPGVVLIEPEPRSDERGFLVRTFCQNEFEQQGLNTVWAQISTVYNPQQGTLRGMHFQRPPFGEVKLIRCTAGAVYDVIVDLRPSSPMYGKWIATELSAANHCSVYVPVGCAHGMQTLVACSELLYMMSVPYHGPAADGVRWDDPFFAITWPAPPESGRMISQRDGHWADFMGSSSDSN